MCVSDSANACSPQRCVWVDITKPLNVIDVTMRTLIMLAAKDFTILNQINRLGTKKSVLILRRSPSTVQGKES